MATPTFNITRADGAVETHRLRPIAQMRYEADFKEPIFSSRDGSEMKMTKLFTLAWYAAGKPGDNLADWLEDVDDVDMKTPESEALDEEEDADLPT